MTDEEFNTYVLNSYIQDHSTGSSSGAKTRQLRGDASTDSAADLTAGSFDTASLVKTIESLITSLIGGLTEGTASSGSSANILSEGTSGSQASYQFSDFWDWRPHQKPTPTPTTSAPATTQPAATSSPAVTEEATVSAGSVDWSTSECVAPIQSQGACGSCWAFVTVSAVESAQCIANGKTSLTKYSEQQLVSCNTQNWGCNGGAPVYAFDYVQQNGLCTEDSYPYTSDSGYADSCGSSCSAQDTGITGYSQLSGEDELLSAIDEHPVVVAVASGNNVWKQYTGGVVSSCDTSDLDHAVVAVGYDSSSIKIRNSWGTYWGEDGYIRLARSSSSDGTCGVTSDMSTPQV
jgi:C1A family cysteine protease